MLAVLSTACCALAATATAQVPALTTGLSVRPGALLGRPFTIDGNLGTTAAGRVVELQAQRPDGSWAAAARPTVSPIGTFSASMEATTLGPLTLRALIAGTEAIAASGPPATAVLTIYRPARATWFGPGFYGRRTACGQRMSRRLVGVAHRTLPCGTLVAMYFGGRTISVPVIDRGPYANGASYDLTAAAAKTLGLRVTSTIGVLPRRGATVPAQVAPAAPASGGYVAAP